MRIAKVLAMTCSVALTACVGAAAPSNTQTVAFLRGCWVQKESPGGRVEAFLRLLPAGTEVGAAFRGDVVDVRHGEWRSTHRLTFGADGAYMSLHRNPLPTEIGEGVLNRIAEPPQSAVLKPVEHRSTWKFPPIDASEGWIVADGTHDTLRIYLLKASATEGEVIFDGERDGCD